MVEALRELSAEPGVQKGCCGALFNIAKNFVLKEHAVDAGAADAVLDEDPIC